MKKVFSFILMAAVAIGVAQAQTPQQDELEVECGSNVQISATPATGYHFVMWNDENTDNPRLLQDIHASAVYVASFAINHYSIKWNNWDGTLIREDDVTHGATVTYGDTDPLPTKEATAKYTYTFAGWSPTIVSPAVDNASYTAEFTETINKYLITFKNWDGSQQLQASQVEYDAVPEYSGATPTKPADAENTYTFSGWDTAPETGGGTMTVPAVTGEATYYAQFNATKNNYDIATAVSGGNELCVTSGDGNYQYGTEVTITASTTDNCYRFVKWNDGVTDASRKVTVTGTATYTAIFEKITYTITVQSEDSAQGTVSVTAVQ